MEFSTWFNGSFRFHAKNSGRRERAARKAPPEYAIRVAAMNYVGILEHGLSLSVSGCTNLRLSMLESDTPRGSSPTLP
jgi:hypothetical protein